MSYNYNTQKKNIFTEEGQVCFLKIRDRAIKLINESGAATMGKIISGISGGDSWDMLACVDRLVELGELKEVNYGKVSGQNRIFTK